MDEPRATGRAPFRPVLLEVAGSLDDAVCAEATRRLRQYRNRYAPILRLVATLTAPPVAEAELFGDSENENKNESEKAFARRPRAAITAERRIVIARRLHKGGCPLAALEAFMAYRFLPLALTHNISHNNKSNDNNNKNSSSSHSQEEEEEEDVSLPFVLRHYVHESTRTASFLVADPAAGTAALIDPQRDTAAYECDLSRLGVRLVAVVLTHCFVDIALGHEALLAAHPQAVLITGDPLGALGAIGDPLGAIGDPLGAIGDPLGALGAIGDPLGALGAIGDPLGEPREICLSGRVALRAVAVPSFAPESLVVELRLDAAPLALFTGTALGTDSVPRTEFFTAHGGNEGGNGGNVELARQMLLSRVMEPYGTGAHDHVVLFPSHGGYSNASHQLDLFWAAHMGDIRRMRHTRAAHDTLKDAGLYAAHLRARPTLPTPPLFAHVRAWNAAALGKRGRAMREEEEEEEEEERDKETEKEKNEKEESPASCIIVDTRDAAAHAAAHIVGSVSVPMSFPAAAYGAKRAELWLQCMLRPRQPIVAIVSDTDTALAAEVRRRLALISPDAPVEVFTAASLRSESTADMPICPIAMPSLLPLWPLRWVDGDAARLDRYEHLRCIEPRDDTVVLDCRTSYEFRNGSHPHSAHVPLAELCEMTAKDTNGVGGGGVCGPSPLLGPAFIERLCDAARGRCAALRRGEGRVVVYCATGYRSLIAASLLRRAFEAAALPVEVRDVAGGALQIMKQRPDLWTVKDRSILCIS